MNEAIDYSTVKWVKQELDATLKQARQALEAYVENPEDDSQLRFCAVHLHQVYGTLQMVELYGAALLAEEMEGVVEALISGGVGQKEEAYELIMRGVLQLPDYLERIIAGHRDVPLVLLPLLNDLRAIRGQKLLSENSLFTPDISRELPESALLKNDGGNLQAQAKKLRHTYQLALLGWFRNKDVNQNLTRLNEVVGTLQASCRESMSQRLWWIAGGMITAIRENWLETSMSTKLLLGQVDRQIKRIIDEGEHALTTSPPNDLMKNLLFYVARATDGGEPVSLIKDAYNLNALMPDADELADAQSSLSGHNTELMSTVSVAIKEDLARVKDALDLFLRGGRKSVADLQPAAETLARIGDTLGMLGLGPLRKAAQEQAESAANMVAGRSQAEENALMDIASALLYVESSLDALVQGKGAVVEKNNDEMESDTASNMADAEFNQVRGVVADEAIRDIAQAKDAILTFMEDRNDFATLEKVPQLFNQVKGSLLLLGEDRAAELMDAARTYLRRQILETNTAPGDDALDDFADTISSIEYYLESMREGRVFGHTILDVAAKSLDRLNAGVPDSTEIPDATDADLNNSTLEQDVDCVESIDVEDLEVSQIDVGSIDNESLTSTDVDDDKQSAVVTTYDQEDDGEYVRQDIEEISLHNDIDVFSESGTEVINDGSNELNEAEVRSDDITPEASAKTDNLPPVMALSDDIDDEILEIFIEESEEELANINEFLPRWLGNPDDQDALVDMRRSFHTLKGSGRLVGAMRIGEFAWAFENMLNRVIDGTIARSDVLCGLLDKVTVALPELVAQIRDNSQTTQPIEAMAAMAEALSRGEEVTLNALSAPIRSEESQVTIEASDAGPASRDGIDSEASHYVGSIEPDVSMLDEIDITEDFAVNANDPFADEPAISSSHADDENTESRIDPVLYEIFSTESRDHLTTIQSFIEDCCEAGMDCRVTEDLLRALHTLHGSARMAGADEIAELAFEIEKYGKALRNDNLPMPDEGLDLVRSSVNMINTLLAELSESDISCQKHTELVDAIARLPRATESVAHIPSAEVPIDEIDFTEAEELNLDDITLDEHQDEFAVTEDDMIPGELDATEESDPFVDLIESSDTEQSVDYIDYGVAQIDNREDAGDEYPDPSLTKDARDPVTAVDQHELSAPSADIMNSIPAEEAAASDNLVTYDYDDADQDLLEVFLEEGEEILAASDSTLHSWIKTPDDNALMTELQRHLHTLKGGARMADLAAVGDLSHALESLLIAVVDGLVQPSTQLFDTLLVAQDRLVHMVEAVRDRKPMHAADSVIAQLDAIRRGDSMTYESAHTDTTSVNQPVRVEDQQDVVENPVPVVATDPIVSSVAEESKSAPRTQQELVRVRADLLDNMVNYAGEISIYRSRLEQQIGSMRFNLGEFGQTVDRIREQLRKLEIETEAQVLFRYERDSGGMDEQFDPLEMDRYSNLQQLSRSMMEGVSDLVSIQGLLDNITRESETLLLQQSRVNTELQEGLMRTRMVPFAGLAPRMRRIVRQAAQELGKRAELQLEGVDGEMDRTVIDRIIAPIEHMLRNAIAHGIETPDKRKASGKSATGTIKVSLSRDGSEVVIMLADDGAGMNLDAIRRKAIERGLIADGDEYSDTDILQFVLETGFSTAESVSQIAGRGVGMDVVNSEVKQLGGSLHIDSKEGQGTTFTIRLPFTLAISQALLVQVHEEIYAIPLTGIEGIVRMTQDELSQYMNNHTDRFEYAGNAYPLYNLGEMLGHGAQLLGAGSPKRLPVLLVRSGDHRMALQVEALLGSRETVVKSVGPQISTVRGISGATILGDGRVVLILDLGGLLRSGGTIVSTDRTPAEPLERQEDRPILVMVVDDSITVRKVTTRLLERNDMESITAKDGVDAVAKLQEHIPDVMLLDIEMPRMDGFELATHVRNEARLRNIPIIMITSRTGDKHRKRAMEIGVNRYLGKPFQESELLSTIRELAEERRSNG